MRLLPLMVLLACGGTTTPDDNYPPPDPLDPELTSCSLDDDCVAVELGCCDACNGGLAVAVNTASVTQVQDEFTETCAANQACTEIGCAPWVLSCVDGTCDLERGSL